MTLIGAAFLTGLIFVLAGWLLPLIPDRYFELHKPCLRRPFVPKSIGEAKGQGRVWFVSGGLICIVISALSAAFKWQIGTGH